MNKRKARVLAPLRFEPRSVFDIERDRLIELKLGDYINAKTYREEMAAVDAAERKAKVRS